MTIRTILAAATLAAGPLAGAAAAFPEKPVTMVVGFSAGGGMDTLGRIVAEAAGEALGQQIAVENRPGAGGTIAPAHVAGAAADGHTLYLGETAALTGPVVFGEDVGYDPLGSFVPIAQLAVAPLAVIANVEVEADDPASFIERVRAEPGAYFYGAPGVATLQHMAMEQLKDAAGIDLDVVQYQGGAPTLAALVSGEVSFAVTSLSAAVRQAEGGDVKVLAVTTAEPVEGFEDIPTVASAVDGFEAVPRQFVMAPADTPADAVAALTDAFRAALDDPEVQARLRDRGLIPSFLSGEQLMAELPEVTETWSATARALIGE